jgi:hypothetical protein
LSSSHTQHHPLLLLLQTETTTMSDSLGKLTLTGTLFTALS